MGRRVKLILLKAPPPKKTKYISNMFTLQLFKLLLLYVVLFFIWLTTEKGLYTHNSFILLSLIRSNTTKIICWENKRLLK